MKQHAFLIQYLLVKVKAEASAFLKDVDYLPRNPNYDKYGNLEMKASNVLGSSS